MNRAQRRRRRNRQAPPNIQAFAAAYRCPDCLSETPQPVQDWLGFWHIEVRHDETCPTYRNRKERSR